MKRFFFSALALIVAATACTESGIIDMPEFYGKAIVFDTYIGKSPVTKAINIDKNYLIAGTNSGAYVFAYLCDVEGSGEEMVANNVDYTSAYLNGRLICTNSSAATAAQNPANPIWQYQYPTVTTDNDGKTVTTWTADQPYMPSEKDLAFVAYNTDSKSCITGETAQGFDFEVNSTVANQVDLLVTPLTPVKENSSGDTQVALNFSHLLSRVGFKVLPTSKNETAITIHSVKLCGSFPKNGYVNLTAATPAITPYTNGEKELQYSLFTTGSFTTSGKDCVVKEGEVETIVAKPIDVAGNGNRYMMIMPGAQSNAYIEVNYSLGGGETRYSKIELASTWEFVKGKAYEFIFKINSAAIEFSAEVVEGDWDKPSSSDLN